MRKLKFELVQPHDAATIEGSKAACLVATLILGEGWYAIRELDENGEIKDGGFESPLMALGIPTEWLKENFGTSLKELMESTSNKDIAEALISVARKDRHRSSDYDFQANARKIGRRMLKQYNKEQEKKKCQQKPN
jgi:hypothetical protein